jgi:hypothetical protein
MAAALEYTIAVVTQSQLSEATLLEGQFLPLHLSKNALNVPSLVKYIFEYMFLKHC